MAPSHCLRKLFVVALVFSFFLQSSALAQDQASEFEELEAQLFEHFKGEKFDEALEIALKLYRLNPKHVNTLYNIAILHSKLGNKEKSYEWFEKAAETGGLRSFRRSYFERYIAMLEHKDRDAFQKPDQIMAALAIKGGEQVADIGAGSGYFTLRLARAVGPKGTVWAVDIEQAMLDHIEHRLKEEGLQNVKLQQVSADDPQLPQGKLNTILLVHTYAYLQNRTEYAKKLRKALTPGGRVVIIEYIPASWEKRPWGPLPHQQVSREKADAEMAKAGFSPSKVHEFLPGQYFVEYIIQEKK
jgi:ubiquinone/menaquinone biosynthesis C-methylase UbiE